MILRISTMGRGTLALAMSRTIEETQARLSELSCGSNAWRCSYLNPRRSAAPPLAAVRKDFARASVEIERLDGGTCGEEAGESRRG